MSQFDTYDYGYEDEERSEEVQESFQNDICTQSMKLESEQLRLLRI